MYINTTLLMGFLDLAKINTKCRSKALFCNKESITDSLPKCVLHGTAKLCIGGPKLLVTITATTTARCLPSILIDPHFNIALSVHRLHREWEKDNGTHTGLIPKPTGSLCFGLRRVNSWQRMTGEIKGGRYGSGSFGSSVNPVWWQRMTGEIKERGPGTGSSVNLS